MGDSYTEQQDVCSERTAGSNGVKIFDLGTDNTSENPGDTQMPPSWDLTDIQYTKHPTDAGHAENRRRLRITERNGTARCRFVLSIRCFHKHTKEQESSPLNVTHREYQIEEEQHVFHASHAAGHHFRNSHYIQQASKKITETWRRASLPKCVVVDVAFYRNTETDSILFGLYASSFSASLFSFRYRQQLLLSRKLARRLFVVKCAPRGCEFVVARYTLGDDARATIDDTGQDRLTQPWLNVTIFLIR